MRNIDKIPLPLLVASAKISIWSQTKKSEQGANLHESSSGNDSLTLNDSYFLGKFLSRF